MNRWEKQTGFTIVELLIVVVVIAVLAAITIVSFNGIQQRANNTAIIDAASKSNRILQAYITDKGVYPYTVNDTYVCITSDTSCRRNSGPLSNVSSFHTEIAKIGTLPKGVPLVSNVRGGVMYHYLSARTVNGVSAPAAIVYYLKGINTDCGVPVLDSEGPIASVSSAKYTQGNVGASGSTLCAVSLPGPGV